MRELQIQGYISGIRDEFILEAQPKALAALIPAETAAPAAILSTPKTKSRPRLKKRWIPAIVAAAIAVTVGLNLGLYSGITAIMGTGSGFFPSGSPSAPGGSPFGDLFGSLFPFLSPDTEPPYEVTVRDPDSPDEPDGPEESDKPDDPAPPETETPHPCANGHAWRRTFSGKKPCPTPLSRASVPSAASSRVSRERTISRSAGGMTSK